ncbi:lanthionine synthetase C family protein [Micromonospora endophytica]|uniref:Lantibiotic modifying enzyme n=1 Tax=Micromonospora endophytica TaxID=515350 RepID=A0A2W2CER1_9ACTN|nr:lanthionine synthetase C family protein [Micromonospora endophytica]PZF97002.1 lantibiotic modifying enzyme [Micromonospora endophytica]RIW41203.1 lantibiotic modifying enzyme [Micromonospora endophytica]
MTRPHPAALAAATATAEALADPRAIHRESLDRRARPQSLAGGAVGIALLHIERARAGRGDDAAAHAWLKLAASQPISAGGNANLFHGAPALGFALHAAGTTQYRRTLSAIDDTTIALTRTRLAAAHARIDRDEPLLMREFDLIHGLTGLGVYHLHRHPAHPITRDVLGYLVRLTHHRPSSTGPEGLPPWWMSVGLSGEPHPDHPHGHGNIGVAHGINAVIALLSLAVLHNLHDVGIHDALARLCAWTDEWRRDDSTGAWWPGYLTIDHVRRLAPPQRPRPSWCYGIAGTARAQQLAGIALDDTTRQITAEHAMLAALRDPSQRALLPEIGLCHGKAGLLQSAFRMAVDARSPALVAELPDLAAHLATQLTQNMTDPELMDGAAGAALALHAVGTSATPASAWDAVLLLA